MKVYKMRDQDKTKEQLRNELVGLHHKLLSRKWVEAERKQQKRRCIEEIRHKGKAYGIDISPAMLKVTKRRLEEVQVIDRVELYCGGVPRRVAQPFRLFLWTSTISMKVSTLAFQSASE